MSAIALLIVLAGLGALPSAPAGPAPAAGPGPGADPGEVFVRANAAYEEGDYAAAITLYRSLLERGFDSGHVHYNLGNAYLRQGELGRAVAAYRRSQARLPRDEDVAANLAFARKKALDALTPPEPSPVATTLFFWHRGLSRPELARLLLILNALLWCVVTLRLLSSRSEALRWLAWGLAAAVLALGISLAIRTLRPMRLAVVVPGEATVHAGTREDAVVRFKLHAGAEVEVAEVRDGWLRIRLPDGEQGWIAEGDAELVTL